MPRIRCPSCKKLCFYIVLLTILAIAFFYYCVFLPIRHYHAHEHAYFKELEYHQSIESQWRWFPLLMGNAAKPLPYNQRITPMIHDVQQLRSWDYMDTLGLYEDETARYPMQQVWIYVGGTYVKRPFLETFSLTPPNGSCVDPPYICDAYNEGFNHLIEYHHTHGGKRTRSGTLFMDCDVSPLLCCFFGVNPVMLLYLETMQPCSTNMADFSMKCSTRWYLVPLPLKKMPFSRTEKIGGHVVPVFPSAFEQLAAMVSCDGSQNALDLKPRLIREKIVVDNT